MHKVAWMNSDSKVPNTYSTRMYTCAHTIVFTEYINTGDETCMNSFTRTRMHDVHARARAHTHSDFLSA